MALKEGALKKEVFQCYGTLKELKRSNMCKGEHNDNFLMYTSGWDLYIRGYTYDCDEMIGGKMRCGCGDLYIYYVEKN